ncbi:hypothetical protein ACFZDJ_05950 [Streptomyces sp. NPDC007896]|uniref:hypothetical protein n=1 Tax=Streptomyces sp. NPDC007896 TaxID=3364784 RepID=UPI0036E265D3
MARIGRTLLGAARTGPGFHIETLMDLAPVWKPREESPPILPKERPRPSDPPRVGQIDHYVSVQWSSLACRVTGRTPHMLGQMGHYPQPLGGLPS